MTEQPEIDLNARSLVVTDLYGDNTKFSAGDVERLMESYKGWSKRKMIGVFQQEPSPNLQDLPADWDNYGELVDKHISKYVMQLPVGTPVATPVSDASSDAVMGYIHINSVLDTYQKVFNKTIIEILRLPSEVTNSTKSAHTSPQ